MSVDRDQVIAALPGYEIGGEIGRGAWGIVLAAEHRQLHRQVAVKQLSPDFAEDDDVQRRFVSEARLLASLDHPHVVPIYDFVERDGVCLLIMERLTGGTLRSRVRAGGLTPQAACGIVVAACAGLHHAHQKGVLHRDVKPENLMFSESGTLKVTDFGIAKVVGGATTAMTKEGYFAGTPSYVAPEQVTSGELGPATDVYAAGMVLFELLTGAFPFPPAEDPVHALYQHAHVDPARLREYAPDLPAELDEVTARAIARDVAERFADASEFGSALERAAARSWGDEWWSASGGESHRVAAAPAPAARPTVAIPTAATKRAAPAPAAERERRPGRARLAAAAAGAVAIVAAAVALLAGGGEDGKKTATATAPAETTTAPPPPTQGVATTGTPTVATAGAIAVARRWFEAYDAGDDRRAASYFAPGVNANGNLLRTRADAEAYMSGLGCSGRLTEIRAAGSSVTLVIPRSTQREGHGACDIPGQAFVIGIRVRDGKIVDWD